MSRVLVDITMSLDGFIAGKDISTKQALGAGGLRLHDWLFGAKTAADEAIMAEVTASSGAIILGRWMYDSAIDEAWEGLNPFSVPAYVVTSRPAPEKQIAGFSFVNTGIESALAQAQNSAGDKDIWIIGGANLIQQYLKAGLVDELRVHIAPVLFGDGTRLFGEIGAEHLELEQVSLVQTPAATHLRYRIQKSKKI